MTAQVPFSYSRPPLTGRYDPNTLFPNLVFFSGWDFHIKHLVGHQPSLRELTVLKVKEKDNNPFGSSIRTWMAANPLIRSISLPVHGLDGQAMYDSFHPERNSLFASIRTLGLQPEAAKAFLGRALHHRETSVKPELIEDMDSDEALGTLLVNGLIVMGRSPDRPLWTIVS
ncbi:hypothetical protein DL93DRAFT_2074285 [Clavulina sp. PMI_390]|nr:hypothetical protein DL93DRAFT_2074285 [Clavulina sp. PMI_390]